MRFSEMRIFNFQAEYVVVLIAAIQVVQESSCFRVERPAGREGDVFERNSPIRVDGGTLTLTGCRVGGEGNAFWKNETYCQCSYSETFVIDWEKRNPKCMEDYGEDKKDMGCKFHFSGLNWVKSLNPTSISNDIGQLTYDEETVYSFQIQKSEIWNIKWEVIQNPFEINTNGNLKWSSTNPTRIARRYAGVLFKLNLEAYRSGKKKQSCLLLKIIGTRSYPLTFPEEQTSQVSSSTAVPESSHYHSKTVSTNQFMQSSVEFQPTRTLSTQITTMQRSASLHSLQPTLPPSVPQVSSKIDTRTIFGAVTVSSTLLVTGATSSTTTPPSYTPSSSLSGMPQTNSSNAFTKALVLRMTSVLISISGIPPASTSKMFPMPTNQTILTSSTVMQSVISFPLSVNKGAISTSSWWSSTVHVTKVPAHSQSYSHPHLLPSASVQIDGAGTAARKSSNEEGVMIGVAISAGIVFVFASIMVLILYRRRHLPKGESRKRKETITLGLASHAFGSSSFSGSINAASFKKDIGNPAYEENLHLRTSYIDDMPSAALYEDNYLVPTEPVYRELVENGPVYSEATGIYEPIDEKSVMTPDSCYQALDMATQPRDATPSCAAPLHAPLYHCLEESNPLPMYQTLERAAQQPVKVNEPLYQELESGQATLNVGYEEDQV